jgi:hypothetical protein
MARNASQDETADVNCQLPSMEEDRVRSCYSSSDITALVEPLRDWLEPLREAMASVLHTIACPTAAVRIWCAGLLGSLGGPEPRLVAEGASLAAVAQAKPHRRPPAGERTPAPSRQGDGDLDPGSAWSGRAAVASRRSPTVRAVLTGRQEVDWSGG